MRLYLLFGLLLTTATGTASLVYLVLSWTLAPSNTLKLYNYLKTDNSAKHLGNVQEKFIIGGLIYDVALNKCTDILKQHCGENGELFTLFKKKNGYYFIINK